MHLRNLSRTAAVVLPTMSRDDHERLLVVAMASFALPLRSGTPPRWLEDQPLPPLTDEYEGNPTSSPLRREGQSIYTRPGTDVYLRGHAWAPRGQLAQTSELYLRVGPCARHARVLGDRVWVRHFGDLRASPAARFERVPISWSRSFGGTPKTLRQRSLAASSRNPVGRGLFDDASEADDQPLPNFEDPKVLIRSARDRPTPIGFGPIARHWEPRRSHAGTYDHDWIETRAPLWPNDMDERLFCAAAPGLCAQPHLVGGEPVELLGAHPDGAIAFELPTLNLQARFEFHDRSERHRLVLDAVELDADAWTLRLIGRACSSPADRDLAAPSRVTLRELAAWELA